jgi:hypothetical protein
MLGRVENTQTAAQLEQARWQLALRSGSDNYGLTFMAVTQNRSVILSIRYTKEQDRSIDLPKNNFLSSSVARRR